MEPKSEPNNQPPPVLREELPKSETPKVWNGEPAAVLAKRSLDRLSRTLDRQDHTDWTTPETVALLYSDLKSLAYAVLFPAPAAPPVKLETTPKLMSELEARWLLERNAENKRNNQIGQLSYDLTNEAANSVLELLTERDSLSARVTELETQNERQRETIEREKGWYNAAAVKNDSLSEQVATLTKRNAELENLKNMTSSRYAAMEKIATLSRQLAEAMAVIEKVKEIAARRFKTGNHRALTYEVARVVDPESVAEIERKIAEMHPAAAPATEQPKEPRP
jgi:uncharacterized coiled-coil protein SlyX